MNLMVALKKKVWIPIYNELPLYLTWFDPKPVTAISQITQAAQIKQKRQEALGMDHKL